MCMICRVLDALIFVLRLAKFVPSNLSLYADILDILQAQNQAVNCFAVLPTCTQGPDAARDLSTVPGDSHFPSLVDQTLASAGHGLQQGQS